MKQCRVRVALALALCGTLVLAFTARVDAGSLGMAGRGQGGISLGAAATIGLLYYLSLSPWLANLGFTVLYRPLVAGTLVGLVMGRMSEGIAIGANINVLYLGWIAAGGSLPGDPGLAGYLGTALALSGGLDAESALALAAPLGLLGGLTFSLRMTLCSAVPHVADRLADRADIGGVARSNYIYSQPLLLLVYAVPVAAAAYLGSEVVGGALSWVAQNASWALSGLYAASGLLSALGIALTLTFLLRDRVWPYFLIGFAVTSMRGGETNMVLLSVVGACVAILHTSLLGPITDSGQHHGSPSEVMPPGAGLLTRKDVFQAWLRWLFFSHSAWNWERMQGLGFAHSMTPIIEKLYTTKEDVRAALRRHLVFFNTQPDLGGVIHGAVIAMEEERASGADISDEAINGVKTGLMGPLAGVGDTVQQGIIIPIALSIGMSLATGGTVGVATRGTVLGPIVFAAVMAAFAWGVGWFVWWQGYAQGRAAVLGILRSGTLQKVISGAGVMGNFVMGALVVEFVSVSTPVAFRIGGTTVEVAALLDTLMPNLLPLAVVLGLWWLVSKRRVSPTTILGFIILVGVLGSYPLWPGIDGDTGEVIRVGLLK
jgi:PTS system mannose-specific IID component